MVKNPDTPLVAATRNQAMNTNHQGSPLGEELFLSSLDKFGVWDHLESQPEEKKKLVCDGTGTKIAVIRFTENRQHLII